MALTVLNHLSSDRDVLPACSEANLSKSCTSLSFSCHHSMSRSRPSSCLRWGSRRASRSSRRLGDLRLSTLLSRRRFGGGFLCKLTDLSSRRLRRSGLSRRAPRLRSRLLLLLARRLRLASRRGARLLLSRRLRLRLRRSRRRLRERLRRRSPSDFGGGPRVFRGPPPGAVTLQALSHFPVLSLLSKLYSTSCPSSNLTNEPFATLTTV
mmetsp:Transcript_3626/g.5882  ORF Transcript_3626/g.5882 Transcript_3626/m.5882 type:complete len:209 (+) Transcript_3626:60-686(+)